MFRLITILAVLASLSISQAEDRVSDIYPYDVKVSGELAVAKEGANSVFATVEKPVAKDAEVILSIDPGQVIVNIFPINPKDGSVAPDAPTKIIFLAEANTFKLDATMDKSTLEPGSYGMNIVAGDKTCRVRFVVKE
ncbi:hypothetical protein OAF27_02225 [Verrucomicrobiales bacterium]|nr:hypothetical protein [Verrucomicrobiales bacterium]